jgi:hypothetical protein
VLSTPTPPVETQILGKLTERAESTTQTDQVTYSQAT